MFAKTKYRNFEYTHVTFICPFLQTLGFLYKGEDALIYIELSPVKYVKIIQPRPCSHRVGAYCCN